MTGPTRKIVRAAPRPSVLDGFDGTIIAIGPRTDAVLDRFNLPDTLIPRLRVLTQNRRSSQWEATLRTDRWGLSYEQAANLASAMAEDLADVRFAVSNNNLFVFLI